MGREDLNQRFFEAKVVRWLFDSCEEAKFAFYSLPPVFRGPPGASIVVISRKFQLPPPKTRILTASEPAH